MLDNKKREGILEYIRSEITSFTGSKYTFHGPIFYYSGVPFGVFIEDIYYTTGGGSLAEERMCKQFDFKYQTRVPTFVLNIIDNA